MGGGAMRAEGGLGGRPVSNPPTIGWKRWPQQHRNTTEWDCHRVEALSTCWCSVPLESLLPLGNQRAMIHGFRHPQCVVTTHRDLCSLS